MSTNCRVQAPRSSDRRSGDAIERAIQLLDYAISLDPSYARAYAAKADCYLVAQSYRPPKGVLPQAKKAIETALRLDDSMGEAYASLGLLTGLVEHDWAKAEIAFEHGISLSPRYATLHHWYAQMLMAQGRFDEALSAMNRASEIEPNSLIIRTSTAWLLFYAGHVREAFAHIEATRKMDPDFLPGHETYALILMANGQPNRAIPVLKQLYASGGRTLFSAGALGMAYAMTGHVAEAEGELSTLKQLARRQFIPAIAFAEIHANLGDTDEAFRWLDQAYANQEIWLAFVNVGLTFNVLRGDPRFNDLLRRIGLEPRDVQATTPSATKAKRSLAVMPFENRNADEDAAYLADEIPASIINRLSQVSGLRVVPRSTVFRLSDQNLDRKELVRRLNVQTLLAGQVAQRGGQLIIRVDLVDVESDSQIWGERFTKTAAEWLTVEEEIAQKISESLKLKLTGAERAQLTKRYTENSDAYRAYLEGRFWWNKRSAEGFKKAIEYFQQAIDHDPNYALALAGLADTHILLGIYQLVPPNDAVREARIAAQAALRADDRLAEAHVSMGGVQAFYDWDWTSAPRSFERAIELNPNYATAYHWGTFVYVAQGNLDRATDMIEHANQLDPLSLIIMADLGRLYRLAGRYNESEQVYLKAREIDSKFAPIVRELAVLYMETNRVEKGIEILEAAYTPTNKRNGIASTLGQAYALAGETAKARDLLRTWERLASKQYVSPMVFASIYAGLGEKDRAIEYLDRAYQLRDPLALRLTLFPALEQLQTDPRVAELMRRGGFTPVRKPPVLKHQQPHKIMLAVLPFDNLSRDPDQEYFTDGMTDEMITTLGRLSPEKLGVIARTSAMRYKGVSKGIDEIGRELSVGYVVEGSIRRAAGRVRISAKLIQVSDQTQLWSNSYERDLADVFKIQVEVAEAIAESLAVELLPNQKNVQAKPSTASSAAYDSYLLGRSYWAKRTPESLYTAIEHFKRAIELDPDYALAYSGLAVTWGVLPWYVPGSYNKMVVEATRAAEQAIALDDSLAESHVAMAGVLLSRSDLYAANEHLRKAVAIDPNNATARQWYGLTLAVEGHYDEAVKEFEKAITLDPLSAVMHTDYSSGMLFARRFDKAIEQGKRALDLQPDFFNAASDLMWAYIGKGDHDEAATSFKTYLRITHQPAEAVAAFRRTCAASGLRAGFSEWLESLGDAAGPPGLGSGRRAALYAWCGEKAQAFDWLDRAVDRQDLLTIFIEAHPAYDNLRDDPRYANLLKRIGAKRSTEEVQPMP